MSNFIEPGEKYGLIFNYSRSDESVVKAKSPIGREEIKQERQKKRMNLTKDKIDVTSFFTWLIENYPSSFDIMREEPNFPERFK